MDDKVNSIFEEMFSRFSRLEESRDEIIESYELIKESYENGYKLLIAGNGGSAADAEHIVGELMKSFVKQRKLKDDFCEKLKNADIDMGTELSKKLQGALPAIALTGHISLSTAYLNDVDPVLGFAQQVNGYGKEGDVFLAISTSGNSKNILYAAVTAKAKGMKVVGLTGKNGGKLKEISDVSIVVKEDETFKIQELHLPVYHALCLALEEYFYSE